jgi:hypothetical protein
VSHDSITSPRAHAAHDGPAVAGRHSLLSGAIVVAASALFLLTAVGTILTDVPAGIVVFVSYAGTGIVLAARRPGQPIAWLLVLAGWGFALGMATPLVSPDELRAGTATAWEAIVCWASAVGWSLAFVALIGLALVFPTGRLAPDGIRRRMAQAALLAAFGAAALILFGPTIGFTPPGESFAVVAPNPFSLIPDWRGPQIPEEGELYVMLFVILIGAAASFVQRYRKATGIHRLQYRWLAWAIVVVMAVNAIWAVTTLALRIDDRGTTASLTTVVYPTIPLAVAAAIFRYHLYDIDRIISRTISWSLVTASLIAIFAGSVVLLQIPLSGLTQGSTFVTAASTLLVLAMFQPIVRRVQAAVDRRFDRPRIEAQRTLAIAAIRLQDEVDLSNLEADLTETVSAAIRPSHVSLWIANGPLDRKGGARRDRRLA